jgi:hypothetical protein
MYTAIKGFYENGQIILEETPPTTQRTNVLVMFLADQEKKPETLKQGVKLGSLAGKNYSIPENFNDPLDDLSEYQ